MSFTVAFSARGISMRPNPAALSPNQQPGRCWLHNARRCLPLAALLLLYPLPLCPLAVLRSLFAAACPLPAAVCRLPSAGPCCFRRPPFAPRSTLPDARCSLFAAQHRFTVCRPPFSFAVLLPLLAARCSSRTIHSSLPTRCSLPGFRSPLFAHDFGGT